MFSFFKGNVNDRRVIKTARTEEAINEAALEGFRPLVKPVKPGKDVSNSFAVYQHGETGQVVVVGDNRKGCGPPYRQVIDWTDYYPYTFPSPFAAYLVPADLPEGEIVWLEDLIEDIRGIDGNQGYYPRLPAWEARWTGEDFEILFNPRRDKPRFLG